MSIVTTPGPVRTEPPGLVRPEYRGSGRRRRWSSIPLRIAVPLLLVALWWIGTATGGISEQVLPGPPKVWNAFVELFRTGQLVDFTLASLQRAAAGVSLGVAFGLLFGVLAGLSALGEELIDATMQINRAIPFLALVPLFIAWFGIDETFKVLLIAVATVAPMYAYTYLGVRNVDRKMLEAARSFGLRGPRLVFGTILPSALPAVLMALRICLSISVTGLIAAEQVGTREGIGYLVSLAQEYNRTDYMVLCVVLYAVLGLVFDAAVRVLERFAMPWRAGVAAR
ncbi:ABC transporter permease [Amycolatopsis azurea]|uniref:Alkanesulfonates transport system permease protein n=1 Tax=Amycolatopsis azurea DSM 43854 TaxID=1238180 RepID=M2PXC9_9PSEU|nr:ABC transporter permease [Amycolatopsis azurea]EMD29288.1 Alkanesulfonates transport system permease protein [Amycolatopsis azurea DSM 43854]